MEYNAIREWNCEEWQYMGRIVVEKIWGLRRQRWNSPDKYCFYTQDDNSGLRRNYLPTNELEADFGALEKMKYFEIRFEFIDAKIGGKTC